MGSELIWLIVLGILVIILTVVSALFVKSKKQNKRQAKAMEQLRLLLKQTNSSNEWQVIAAKWEEQNERREHVMEQFHEVIELLVQENKERLDCVNFLYEHLKRLHNIAIAHGDDVGMLPTLPIIIEQERREFLMNQALQSARLLKVTDKIIKK